MSKLKELPEKLAKIVRPEFQEMRKNLARLRRLRRTTGPRYNLASPFSGGKKSPKPVRPRACDE